jgi:hypothetical protein
MQQSLFDKPAAPLGYPMLDRVSQNGQFPLAVSLGALLIAIVALLLAVLR